MSIAKCQIQFKIYFLSKKKYVLLQKMSDRNKVHNISAMGIQTQDRWIVLVLIYESGIQVLDQNKTKAVEFPLRDALIVHTDQKLKYRISSYKTRGYYYFTRPSSAGIIRMRVLIEGGYYYQNFINFETLKSLLIKIARFLHGS